jgi:predicted DNA-binding transcriptional regulator YafY
MEHPVADRDWAVRHVLQYGPEAEVLEPAAVRQALRERLERASSMK